MAVMPVRKIGDPVLRSKAQPVKEINTKTENLVENLKSTLVELEGLGLAANQIGVLQRVFVIKRNNGEMLEFINPEILQKEGNKIDREGCLSVPEREGPVPRAEKVKLRYQTLTDEEVEAAFSDLEARVIQHELDHLDGVLFVDKVIDLPTASY